MKRFVAGITRNTAIRWLRGRYRAARYVLTPPGSRRDRWYQKTRASVLGGTLALLRTGGDLRVAAAAVRQARADSDEAASVLARGVESARFIEQKIAPLRLAISDVAPFRVNLLQAEINFRFVFGGYLALFNFCMAVKRHGHRVRVVLTEGPDNPELWRRQISGYEGLSDFFDQVEVSHHGDRAIPLKVSPEDRFIASSWWTAHIAHAATRELGLERFIFLSQDFEPVFYPHGSFRALSEEAYRLPQYSLFSTDMLREYFRANRLGVFADPRRGEDDSAAFNNAVRAFDVDAQSLAGRRHKLLFYARPDEHAARNIFELGVLGIEAALRTASFRPGEWDFHAIGTFERPGTLKLNDGVSVTLLPKAPLDDYYALLRQYDLGLSLMHSPHPGLVPLDMAAAGMLAVTNTYATKTAERLSRISANLIPVEATISGIGEGLAMAAARLGDIAGRVAASRLNWPSRWEDTFNDQLMDKLAHWLRQG